MVKHVVMWKFKEGEQENMERFLAGLNGLKGQIPGLLDLETGKDWGGDGHYDAVLIATFRNRADLEQYQKDPRHVAVASICKEIRTSRVAVDFEF